ncbi:hypothetical protein [Haemophilus parainfluenzae]|uniref:hypothetical protein n=1 Tax=Haemophilus parainfluenzae TaxID=729 RepID=UPI001A9F73EE|nr:hypothetical protein [Haemophilus parainfluenzae]MBS7064507.1 hypothetical protein [Haemophilus parainfluenzae]
MLIKDVDSRIRENLNLIDRGKRVNIITIGYFTDVQFSEINKYRIENDLPELLSNEIVYMGRHHYNSRVIKDGYSIDDLIEQIKNSLNKDSVVVFNKKGSCLKSAHTRDDGYGNTVTDFAVFEFTARKPKAELYCVVPKGDIKKPPK